MYVCVLIVCVCTCVCVYVCVLIVCVCTHVHAKIYFSQNRGNRSLSDSFIGTTREVTVINIIILSHL